MRLISQLIRSLLTLLLIAIFGMGGAGAAPGDWTQVSYPVVAQEVSVQPVSLTNTARAPPTASANVMATGAAPMQNGSMRALAGVESPEAAYALLRPSIAPNTTGGSTRIVPGGGLQAHGAAGGHLIQRHVGQTDADLIARLNAQPNITAASSFPNRATAENAVSSALDANTARINDFLNGSSNRLVLNHDTGSVVGSVVQRGSTTPVSSTNVRVVLQRDASMPTGYRIVTGFPTP